MDHIDRIIQAYRTSGVAIDSNLLLLWVIGRMEVSTITRFKRTRGFDADDFTLLEQILARFARWHATPSVFTEVSNHLRQLPGGLHRSAFEIFHAIAASVDERHFPAEPLLRQHHVSAFGLTDLTLMALAADGRLVLTVDGLLDDYLLRCELGSVNFNHLRS
jgi:hypothetical protein